MTVQRLAGSGKGGRSCQEHAAAAAAAFFAGKTWCTWCELLLELEREVECCSNEVERRLKKRGTSPTYIAELVIHARQTGCHGAWVTMTSDATKLSRRIGIKADGASKHEKLKGKQISKNSLLDQV